MKASKPYVWQMVKKAMDELGPETTNTAVRDWILKRWPDTNRSTIGCQTIVCTVNHNSRVHYTENQKPRKAEGQYDFLFRSGRGKLELYDPAKHGEWEITEQDDGRLVVRQCGDDSAEPSGGESFAAEAHLRDYLAQHLDQVEPGLVLYIDSDDNDGVEYQTPIGRIDILAQDAKGGLLVIELKVGQGPDAVVGQVLRYMGWVRRHIADGKPVRGMIVARWISDKIKYAVTETEGVALKEYTLSLKLADVEPLEGRGVNCPLARRSTPVGWTRSVRS